MRDIVLASIMNKNEYKKIIIQIVGKLTKNKSGAYLGINKDIESIENEMEENGISTKKLLFINSDVESKTFAQLIGSLTGMSLSIQKAADTGKYDFIVLDFIGTSETIKKFNILENLFIYIINKMRVMNIKLVILLDNTQSTKELIRRLSPVCDKTINL